MKEVHTDPSVTVRSGSDFLVWKRTKKFHTPLDLLAKQNERERERDREGGYVSIKQIKLLAKTAHTDSKSHTC